MARNKHTALFEVIKPAPKPDPAARSSNSWFGKAVTPPPPEPAPEPGMPIETLEPAEPEPIAASQITVDPERKEFVVRVSYVGAAVCSFGVMVGLVGAFVLGQRTSPSTVPVLAAMSTDQLKVGPAQPDVLQLGRPVASETPSPASITVPVPQVAEPVKENKTWVEPKAPPQLMVQDAQRVIGLHYVLVQSYPKEEEAMAYAARDLLVKHGIECTVEKGLPGWGAEWLSVIGTTGFEKVRSPAFEAYLRPIMDLSSKFAGSAKFKKFEPMAYKWRGSRAAN